MRPRHVLLATIVAIAWGQAYVATQVALESFSPSQAVALRFLLTASLIPMFARPRVSPALLVIVGATLFGGQFAFQALGIAAGVPAGMTAVISQVQVIFTVVLGSIAFRERPSSRQALGIGLGLAGAGVLCSTLVLDGRIPAGVYMIVTAALSWSIGNLLMKKLGRVNMHAVVVWAALVPACASLLMVAHSEGLSSLQITVEEASWSSLSAVVYLALLATVAAYGAWGKLLTLYPSVLVAPFALLVPLSGAAGAMLLLNESFSAKQMFGACIIILGLGITYWPGRLPAREKDQLPPTS